MSQAPWYQPQPPVPPPAVPYYPPYPPPQVPLVSSNKTFAAAVTALLTALGSLGYVFYNKPPATPAAAQPADTTPKKKEKCGFCGAAECGCEGKSKKTSQADREDTVVPLVAEKTTEGPTPADVEKARAELQRLKEEATHLKELLNDPGADLRNMPPPKSKPASHVTDERGTWWAVAESDDADQRSWFSTDAGKTWWRDHKPTLVTVPPTTCKCPAQGNKTGASGPNNCLCHDAGLDCKCHQGAGIVYERLPPPVMVQPLPVMPMAPMMPAPAMMMKSRTVVRSRMSAGACAS